MIDRREILEAASSFSLLPSIVEKDYVLGWMLAGINAHDELGESWVFKGGTCLKKCYFETYRFSEDLDFTLRSEEHRDEEFLRTAFEEVISWVTEQSGLNIPADQLEFDIYDNSRGRRNCQGKIAYRGPVSPTSGGWPKIKLDLTADERLVLPSVRREVFHPYSDRPEAGIWANCYAYEEAFGEKLRALGKPGRDITKRQHCTHLEVKMRFEVKQQDEKWIVWDTVNDCAMKGVARRPPRLTAANCMRRPSIAGLLVMKPNSVASLAAEAGRVTFWTQKEAQVCADILNDLDLQGFIPDLF
jgi:predicted nucleotidyltransferase component of viral defense system